MMDLDRAFWRIDYRTGIAIFWSDNGEDVEDLIRYAGTAQNYLKQRGCEDIIQENDVRTRYTFKPIAGSFLLQLSLQPDNTLSFKQSHALNLSTSSEIPCSALYKDVY